MPRTLHEKDSYHPIGLRAGEEVQLVLVENPTTGFRWRVEPEATSSRYQATEQGVGSGGYRVFLFDGFPVGEHVIRATLSRSWESQTVSEREFRLDVH